MKVVIRADAAVEVGSGHVMRCLALADGLRERGADVVFACRRNPGDLCDFVAAAGYRLQAIRAGSAAGWHEDAALTTAIVLAESPVDWLLVDHYSLDARWETALRPHVGKIMVIDDLADRAHDCDLLLDQNYYPDPEARYQGLVPSSCTQLLGPRFALLRAEFSATRPASVRTAATVKRVFVFLSGADPGNVTGRVLKALDAVAPTTVEADIAVGANAVHQVELARYCASRPGRRLHVQTTKVAQLLAHADLAIGAGGASSWERACMGVPSLVLGMASNQTFAAEALAGQGAQLYLGTVEQLQDPSLENALQLLLVNQQLRTALANRAFSITDGHGVQRVLKRMLPPSIEVRHATAADCELLYAWRNHPDTRRYFFDSRSLDLADHSRWFAATLADRSRVLLIGVLAGRAVGVVRYDLKDDEARASIYLDPLRQGEGLGTTLLAAGSSWLRVNHVGVRSIVAEVLPTNELSLRVFLAAGFQESHRCLRLSLT